MGEGRLDPVSPLLLAAALVAADSAMEDLSLLREGDPAAMHALVRRHQGPLVALAESITGSRALAEDVVQDTWIAVFGGLAGFDGRSRLSTWIVAIVINKARTVVRREGRFVSFAEDGDTGPAVSPDRFSADGHWSDAPARVDGLDPERIYAGRELWRHVSVAVDALPPGQRAVLILRDVQGLAADEACAVLAISPENQRVLLHRARARVRSAVEALEKSGHTPLAAR